MRLGFCLVGAVMACSDVETAAPNDSGDGGEGFGVEGPDFATEVHPIFAAQCLDCHDNDFYGDLSTPDKAYATLMDPKRSVGFICGWEGDDVVPLVSAGDHENSGLWLVSVGTCDDGAYGMPKSNPLGFLSEIDPDAVDAIVAWIDAGAVR